jgi:hypothetical protein
MRTIYKYQLAVQDAQTVVMPPSAVLLTVQVQYDIPWLWALVDPKNPPSELRTLLTCGTGQPVPNKAGRYLGTYQLYSGEAVFHVFEEATRGPV